MNQPSDFRRHERRPLPLGRLFLVALLASVPACSPENSAKKPITLWTPDEALIGQLGDYSQFREFSLRPPKGFQFQDETRGVDFEAVWKTEPPETAYVARLTLLVGLLPEGDEPKKPEQMVEWFIKGAKSREKITEVENTPATLGEISSVPFNYTRFSWTQMEDGRQGRVHGFVYLTRTKNSGITVLGTYIGENPDETLKLMEAAARTLRGIKPSGRK